MHRPRSRLRDAELIRELAYPLWPTRAIYTIQGRIYVCLIVCGLGHRMYNRTESILITVYVIAVDVAFALFTQALLIPSFVKALRFPCLFEKLIIRFVLGSGSDPFEIVEVLWFERIGINLRFLKLVIRFVFYIERIKFYN